MFSTISNIFKIGDLRRKIIFTLLMLVVFRIGSFVPVPNINVNALQAMTENRAFGLFNTFSGGALANFSIFAMGIMPYITGHPSSCSCFRWMSCRNSRSGREKVSRGVARSPNSLATERLSSHSFKRRGCPSGLTTSWDRRWLKTAGWRPTR